MEGTSISASDFLALDQIGQIEAVAQAYRDAEGDLEKQADLQRIFGTQTSETQGALKLLNGDLEAFAQNLEKSGVILNDEARAGLDAFYSDMQSGQDTFARFRVGLISAFAIEIYPRFRAAMQGFGVANIASGGY